MIPNDLHYTFPDGAYIFLVAFLILFIGWRLFYFRKETLEKFASPSVLEMVLVPRSIFNFWSKLFALCLVWILATLALMQPQGNGHYPLEGMGEGALDPGKKEEEAIVKRKAHDVIFLVDASASMSVQDTRTGVSRLDYAKEIVDEVISRLRGETASLHAFTSDTTKLSPSTMDYLFVRLMLRQMQINEGDIAGTNLVEALADMREEYFSVISPKQRTLVILTDGGDTRLETLTGVDREQEISALLNLVGQGEELNLRVFAVGLGTESGERVPGVTYQGKMVTSSLDEDLLRRLSKKGRGNYYFANEATAVDIAEDLIAKMGEDQVFLEEFKIKRRSGLTRGKEDLVFDHYFQLPLGAALLLLAFVLFFPDTRKSKGKR